MWIRMLMRALVLILLFSAQSLAQSTRSDPNIHSDNALSVNSGPSDASEDNSVDAPGKNYAAPAMYDDRKPPPGNAENFRWKAALGDSFKVLMLQNSLRIAIQQKTRDGLSGPFFPDYIDALKRKQSPSQRFMDGDSWGTNFILHPLQGSTVYQVARLNGATRKQAFLWGVGYSAQFEFGPLGEAGIGNVGRSPVDLVVTPTAGFVLGVTEEWLWSKLDKRMDNKVTRLARTLLVGNLISRLAVGR
jgi:hypothetical protein